ncbi:hypothetical protein, variant [Capsaspora owczarzaki ATCC 30864]|uniref:Coiled-coil domain-containing protein 53 n=1 Tax=Capsaspora owczarzaki (strain ATCC 30864) TaxID=595528 RepID=A0A0D2X5Q0_CAPO3|nr:hypothetical protein, variant [Capsaspora owczarzaki ATCC 30864]
MVDKTQLSLVRANADLTKIEPTPHKKTLAFVNHFVSHTVHFLNHFAGVCEEKLNDVAYRIQRLEITLNILETKLNSIPGLEGVTADQYVSPHAQDGAGAQVSVAAPASTSAPPPPSSSAAPPGPSAGAASSAAPPPPPAPEPEAPTNTVSNDPRYAPYFKLVRLGVPAASFAAKMRSEGLDPSLME